MTTFLELRNKLRVRIGNPSTTDVPDATLSEALNDAYRDVATKYPHHKARKLCEFSTVAETADYGLPTNCGAVLRVWDMTNDKRLNKGGPLSMNSDETPESGQPERFVRFRNFLKLDPPPDDVYTIRVYYRENITDLSLDGDEPVTPTTWDTGILILARWYYYDAMGDLPKAGYALNAYRTWISDRSTEIEEEMSAYAGGVELPELSSGSGDRVSFDYEE
jgi:hypothetical protein